MQLWCLSDFSLGDFRIQPAAQRNAHIPARESSRGEQLFGLESIRVVQKLPDRHDANVLTTLFGPRQMKTYGNNMKNIRPPRRRHSKFNSHSQMEVP